MSVLQVRKRHCFRCSTIAFARDAGPLAHAVEAETPECCHSGLQLRSGGDCGGPRTPQFVEVAHCA